MIFVSLILLLWATPVLADVTIIHTRDSVQGSCAAASSCSTSFSTLPLIGHSIIATGSCWNGTATCSASFADNQGHTYTTTCKQDTTGKSQTCVSLIPVIATSSGTFTVTMSAAATTSFEVIASEFESVLTASPTDASKSATNSTGTADTGASSATTQASEVSICAMSQSSSDTNINVTTPTGYTRIGVQQNANATIGFESSYKILSSTGAQQCAWTHDTVGMAGWAAQLVTFKAVAPRHGQPIFFP